LHSSWATSTIQGDLQKSPEIQQGRDPEKASATMRGTLSWVGKISAAAVLLLAPLSLIGSLVAQDRKPETVLVNLLNPCGIAIQPQTGHVFVSSRFGVYCYDPSYKKPKEHRAAVEIDGYPDRAGVFGSGPKYEIGPLGLAFLDKDHLVVGDGSRRAGEDFVRVYKIPAKLPGANDWTKEDAAVASVGPIKAGTDSAKGEGTFYGVAVGAGAIWATSQGDATKGWVAKAEIKDAKASELKIGELKPSIATMSATDSVGPGPITFTPDGKELIVGLVGSTDSDSADSVLAFYDPTNGSLKRKLKTGLRDVSGLAYSPKTHTLYATDFAWKTPHEGGLFALKIEGDTVTTTKIAALDKPTALAFDPSGHLYVSIMGTADKGKGTDPGALLYFRPGL
jgi:DNA-binding beta-propeller fold protein YncE